jgi:hypothetical protein
MAESPDGDAAILFPCAPMWVQTPANVQSLESTTIQVELVQVFVALTAPWKLCPAVTLMTVPQLTAAKAEATLL